MSICNNEYIKNKGFYDTRNKWNSLIMIKGEPYRHRVETLVIKDNKYIFLRIRNNNTYNIPGGSLEYGISNIEQARNETNQEARIDVDNILYSNETYMEDYINIPLQMRAIDYPVKYIGTFNEIYIANFKGKFTGKVSDIDADQFMEREGRFYLIKNVIHLLKDSHIKALQKSKLI